MKFSDLKRGANFYYHDSIYMKISEIRENCCDKTLVANCMNIAKGTSHIIDGDTEVKLIDKSNRSNNED